MSTSPGIKLLATSAYETPEPLNTFIRYAQSDRFGTHTITNDCHEADIILFLESSHYDDDPFFSRLRRHPFVRQYREKCFMYNEQARPFCVLPGLYPNVPRRYFNPQRQRPSCYVGKVNPFIQEVSSQEIAPDLLYSFLGRRNAAVRNDVFEITDPRSIIQDTSGIDVYGGTSSELEQNQRLYAVTMARSSFVLCPRGIGASSYRLYEAMEMGRAPVILSDDFIPPYGPDWESASIRIPEREAHSLPEFLRRRESLSQQVGRAARLEWEEWFSPQVIFHRFAEETISILRWRSCRESFSQRVPDLAYLELKLRSWLRPLRDHISNLVDYEH